MDEKSQEMQDVPRGEAMLGPLGLKKRLGRGGEDRHHLRGQKRKERGQGKSCAPERAPLAHEPLLGCECWGSTITLAHATPAALVPYPDIQARDWGAMSPPNQRRPPGDSLQHSSFTGGLIKKALSQPAKFLVRWLCSGQHHPGKGPVSLEGDSKAKRQWGSCASAVSTIPPAGPKSRGAK